MIEESSLPEEEGEDEIRLRSKYDGLVRQFVAVNTAKRSHHIDVDEVHDFNNASLRYESCSFPSVVFRFYLLLFFVALIYYKVRLTSITCYNPLNRRYLSRQTGQATFPLP